MMDERYAFHKQGGFEVCIDSRLETELKPLFAEFQTRTLVSFIVEGDFRRLIPN